MKRILRSRLVLTFVGLIMLASVIVIPLSGSYIRIHAQTPATVKPYPSLTIVKQSPGKVSPTPSVTPTSRPPVKLPLATGHHIPSAMATNIAITSTTGWQLTGLTVQQGTQFTISYISGTWTVDVNNWPYVGPDGYPSNIDQQIYPGCKYDSTLTYATLLGQIGNGSDFAVSTGGTFTAGASGTLSLRINDQDGCLADNDGSVAMTVGSVQSLAVNQVWTTDNSSVVKTSFVPGDAIYYFVQVNNPNSSTVTATFAFAATGPQTIFTWSGAVSVPPGTTNFYYSTTIPSTAPPGAYTHTVTVIYNGVSSQGQSQFTVTAHRGKLFLFIQGINSTLSTSDAIKNIIPTNLQSFGQSNGIYPFLSNTYPTAQFRMFSYNGANSSGTPNGYLCQDTFTQHLSVFVARLKAQIISYLNNNPNTDVYLIGHSMGGAVALGLLADLRINGFLNVNGGKIAGVVTLDSPLGGTPGGFINSYFTKQHFQQVCKALVPKKKPQLPLYSLDDLFAIFSTGTSTPHGGINMIALTLFGADFTNQEIAADAATNNSPILAIGNLQDWVYYPRMCANNILVPDDYASTEWIADQGNNSGVYGRVFSGGNPTCSNLGQIAENHFVIFTQTSVEQALMQFVNGQTPSALSVAPNGP